MEVTAESLLASVEGGEELPDGLSIAAQTLWLARAGRWDAAHDLCQDVSGTAGSWIHAWLHRQEGDLGNAGYWYAKAGKPTPTADLSQEKEWLEMAKEILRA